MRPGAIHRLSELDMAAYWIVLQSEPIWYVVPYNWGLTQSCVQVWKIYCGLAPMSQIQASWHACSQRLVLKSSMRTSFHRLVICVALPVEFTWELVILSICLTCTRMLICSYGLQQRLGSKVMGKKLYQKPPPEPLKSRIIKTFWEIYGRRPPAKRKTVLQNHRVDAWILKVVFALAVAIYVNSLHAGCVSKDSYITVSSLLSTSYLQTKLALLSLQQQLSPSSDCSRLPRAVESMDNRTCTSTTTLNSDIAYLRQAGSLIFCKNCAGVCYFNTFDVISAAIWQLVLHTCILKFALLFRQTFVNTRACAGQVRWDYDGWGGRWNAWVWVILQLLFPYVQSNHSKEYSQKYHQFLHVWLWGRCWRVL